MDARLLFHRSAVGTGLQELVPSQSVMAEQVVGSGPMPAQQRSAGGAVVWSPPTVVPLRRPPPNFWLARRTAVRRATAQGRGGPGQPVAVMGARGALSGLGVLMSMRRCAPGGDRSGKRPWFRVAAVGTDRRSGDPLEREPRRIQTRRRSFWRWPPDQAETTAGMAGGIGRG